MTPASHDKDKEKVQKLPSYEKGYGIFAYTSPVRILYKKTFGTFDNCRPSPLYNGKE